ncbi:MAG: hypothetical protein ABSF28_15455 [Terracidiphilus sp.]|jgi:hypothetical protein
MDLRKKQADLAHGELTFYRIHGRCKQRPRALSIPILINAVSNGSQWRIGPPGLNQVVFGQLGQGKVDGAIGVGGSPHIAVDMGL